MAVDLLIGEGVSLPSLEPAVSKLVNLLGSTLTKRAFVPDDPFFESLVAENAKIRAALDALRPALKAMNGSDGGAARAAILDAMADGVARLAAVGIHYEKKENVLFPVFEKKYPHWRCVTLMWSLHDTVRRERATIEAMVRGPVVPDLRALNAAVGRLFFAAFAVIFREERILFPLVASLLTKEERFELYRESKGLGFAYLDDRLVAVYDAEAASESFVHALPRMTVGAPEPDREDATLLSLDAGALPLGALDALLKALPVDLTFVDADDKVAWFSNGPERIFPRSPSVIGRDVRNCHPRASLDRVMGIIGAFRSGSRDSEQFWIEHRGRFVHIRYVAVRDRAGNYLGTLESSQDITELRALEGEKRLAAQE